MVSHRVHIWDLFYFLILIKDLPTVITYSTILMYAGVKRFDHCIIIILCNKVNSCIDIDLFSDSLSIFQEETYSRT